MALDTGGFHCIVSLAVLKIASIGFEALSDSVNIWLVEKFK